MSAAYLRSGARAWSCIVMLCLVLALEGGAAQLEPEPRTFELRITKDGKGHHVVTLDQGTDTP